MAFRKLWDREINDSRPTPFHMQDEFPSPNKPHPTSHRMANEIQYPMVLLELTSVLLQRVKKIPQRCNLRYFTEDPYHTEHFVGYFTI